MNEKLSSLPISSNSKQDMDTIMDLVPEKSSHTIDINGAIKSHYGLLGEIKPQIVVKTTVNDYLTILGPSPGVYLYFNNSQFNKIMNILSHSKHLDSSSETLSAPSTPQSPLHHNQSWLGF